MTSSLLLPPGYAIHEPSLSHLPAIKALHKALFPVDYREPYFQQCLVSFPPREECGMRASGNEDQWPLTLVCTFTPPQSSGGSGVERRDEARLVGTVRCRVEQRETEGVLYVQTLGVLAPWRGLGIGQKLLDEAVKLVLCCPRRADKSEQRASAEGSGERRQKDEAPGNDGAERESPSETEKSTGKASLDSNREASAPRKRPKAKVALVKSGLDGWLIRKPRSAPSVPEALSTALADPTSSNQVLTFGPLAAETSDPSRPPLPSLPSRLHCSQRSFTLAQSVTTMRVHVWQENRETLRWYKRRGFHICDPEGDGEVLLVTANEREEDLWMTKNYYRRLRPAGAWLCEKKIGAAERVRLGMDGRRRDRTH